MPPKENILGPKKSQRENRTLPKECCWFSALLVCGRVRDIHFRASRGEKSFWKFFGRGVKGGPPPPPPFGDWEEGRKRGPLKGLLLPFRILTAEGGEGIEGKVVKERRRWRQGKVGHERMGTNSAGILAIL